MRTLHLALVLAASAILSLACGQEEEALQPAASGTVEPLATPAPTTAPPATTAAPAITPGPGVTLYRWVNVTVLVPDKSGIYAGPGVVDYPGKPLHFVISIVDPEDSRIASTVVLDSENGAVVEEQVLDEHRKEMDRVLATLSVGPFERATAPWPYNGEPSPDLVRENAGGISYVRPSPASGLYVGAGIGDPCCPFIDLRNERSVAFIQFRPVGGTSGHSAYETVYDTSGVHEEDKPVFDRWLASIK